MPVKKKIVNRHVSRSKCCRKRPFRTLDYPSGVGPLSSSRLVFKPLIECRKYAHENIKIVLDNLTTENLGKVGTFAVLKIATLIELYEDNQENKVKLKNNQENAEHHEGIAGMDRSETGAAACDGSLGSSGRLLPQLLPCVLSSPRRRNFKNDIHWKKKASSGIR
ncbi:hypothetical protein CEXT_452031 [Caerostris extrusa]|uniref:Uncharacterized protein n=1 Tax=Caerostris extrusa TaxID=172846 RepID=A0AAV4P7F2_CAEEX|nr:hypothetical protein CEXT_452031 [Caerostris extrusa]